MAVSPEVETYVAKVSPKKGDIMVLSIRNQHSLQALAEAQSVMGQLAECAKEGKFDPEIPLIILYGEDKLQSMGAKQLGYLLATENGLVVSTKPVDSINCLSTLYMMCDGQVVAAPNKRAAL